MRTGLLEIPTPLPIGLPVRDVRRKKLNLNDWKKRSAKESDTSELVTEPLIVREAGRVAIVALQLKKLGVDLSSVANALVDMSNKKQFAEIHRSGSSFGQARVFGYMPRKIMFRDYCTASMLAMENPEAHAQLCAAARVAASYYRQTNSDLYRKHVEITANKIRADYHLENTVFTSGIANENNPLPYHRDTGNYREVWSAMFVFKGHGVGGGYLSCPEYDLRFALPDHSLFMFDGQELIHGVTPISRPTPAAYRYSIVFYSLLQMWQCRTIDEELKRGRKNSMNRARKRAGQEPL